MGDLAVAVAVAIGISVPLMVVVTMATVERAGFFTPVHITYFGLVLTLPLIGVGVLLLGRHTFRTSPAVGSVAVLLVLLAPLGLYTSHVEPRWLRVDTVSVPVPQERSGSGTVRVGVISDIQTADVGPYEFGAVDRLMAFEPDVILVPGDVAQMGEDDYLRQRDQLRELLRGLDAPGGVFVVNGDVDGGARLADLVRGTGVHLLVDRTERVSLRDRTLLIGGLELQYGYEGADRVRAELEAEPDDGAITIQLSHRPDSLLELPPDSRVDLTVAGHTHGGQIVLPFFGPPITLSRVPSDIARGGLHELDGNRIYLSNGVGAERSGAPQMRLFNRPSIGILELG